jgi:hypothetical protein
MIDLMLQGVYHLVKEVSSKTQEERKVTVKSINLNLITLAECFKS